MNFRNFFNDLFLDPVWENRVLYFIIEELPNPRDFGVFKILYGTNQIALDAVTLDESGFVIASQLIGCHAAAIRKCPYQKIEYINIAPWAQSKIEDCMARIGLKI